MKRWQNEVSDMLAYVNDVMVPHGVRRYCEGRLHQTASDALAASLMLDAHTGVS